MSGITNLGDLVLSGAADGDGTLTYDSDDADVDGKLVVKPGGEVVFVATDPDDQTDLIARSDAILRTDPSGPQDGENDDPLLDE